ncbi:MAG: DUF4147 domain-containing protein [Myxococcota bacterium]
MSADRLAVLRADARAIAAAAARAVDAGMLVRRGSPPLPDRIRVLGAGKAAAAMARAVEAIAGDRIVDGLVVVPDGYGATLDRIAVRTAGHPVPDARSELAGRALLARVAAASPGDVFVGLWSGGASALIEVPADGWTIAGIAAATADRVRAGVDIAALNAARAGWSRIKGGQLAAAGPASWINLVLSDVPGDDPALVGSGPAVRPGDGTVVVGGLGDALAAAKAEAFALRYAVVVLDPELRGEAADAGRRLAAAIRALPDGNPPMALLLAGEPVVSGVPAGAIGGRMQELALAAALGLEGAPAVVLATSTDGRDGQSDASGALIDGATVARIRAAGHDPVEAQALHRTTAALDAAGDALRTGPTGTNVRDLVIALVGG